MVADGILRFDDIVARLDAVREFAALPEAASLAAANKRISNILKKSEGANAGGVQVTLLVAPLEFVMVSEVPMVGETVVIGDAPLSIDALAAIARQRRKIVLSEGAKNRVVSARAVIEHAVADNKPVYGLTTGLGAGVDTRLSPDDLAAFQRRVAFARAVGVGSEMPADEVRAMTTPPPPPARGESAGQ